MSEKGVSAGQRPQRVVAVVPHTHWDREWSGHVAHLRQRSLNGL